MAQRPRDHWIEQALTYHENYGWELVPVYPFVKGKGAKCSCGTAYCETRFIHPRIYRPDQNAGDSPEEIEEWAAKWARSDLAVLLGEGSGIVALQASSDGEGALDKLAGTFGRLPFGPSLEWMESTRWYIFRHPGHRVPTRQLDRGLKLLGDGELLRLPPYLLSRRQAPLTWHDPPGLTEVASLPDWFWKQHDIEEASSPTSRNLQRRGGGKQASSSLPFQSVASLQHDPTQTLRWVAEPWAAEGAITVLTGPAKRSGKSSFVRDLARAVVAGDSFLAEATNEAPALLLSEDIPGRIEQSFAEMGLTGSAAAERLHVLPHQRVQGMKWADLMRECRKQARAIGARLVIVDSLLRFSGVEHLHELRQRHLRMIDHLKEDGVAVVLTASYDTRVYDTDSSGVDGLGLLASASDIVIELSPLRGDTEGKRLLRLWSRLGPPQQTIIRRENGHFTSVKNQGSLWDQPAALQEENQELPPLIMRRHRGEA